MRLDRINEMEQYILSHGTAALEELSHVFDISMNTVRRDVATLMTRGHIRKTYGGVAAINLAVPSPIAERFSKNLEAKQCIGRLAAELVQNGQTIFMDSGSTVLQMIPHLAHKEHVTIVTHSLSVMYEAAKYPNLNVIALGGQYSQPTDSYVGISTLDALDRIGIDIVFMAATGVSLERGLTNTTFIEAEIKQRVVQRSKDHVVLLADHSKFDHASTVSFFRFDELSAVVTDQMPPRSYLDVVEKNQIRLLCGESEKQMAP